MGERQGWLLEPTFQRAVKVVAGSDRLTSDGGALLLREADHRLGLVESLAARLADPRRQDRIRYTLLELLRFRLYALGLGYSAQDDLDRLCHDPALKLAVWDRYGEQTAEERLSSQPTQSRLIDILAHNRGNREAVRGALADGLNRWVRATGTDHRIRQATIDIDSFPIEVFGRQEGRAYNGYHQAVTYHPLVASFCAGGHYDSGKDGCRLGDGFLHAILRQGNVHTADGIRRFLRNTIVKARELAWSFDVRIDAGFTEGPVLDDLTDEKVRFVGRLKSNAVLEERAAEHLWRPVGRPPKGGYEEVIELGSYQAGTWKHPQRLLLVIIDRPDPKTGQLPLLVEHFFLVTNWPAEQKSADELLAHYRCRGTFEDRLGEFNAAIGLHLSSPKFHENEVLLLLSLLAYNLTSLLRTELETSAGACWDLQRFQHSVLKAGGRLVKHSRRLVLTLARAVTPFWQTLAACLARWRPPERLAPRGPQHRDWMPLPPHAHRQLVLRS
jgi:hypothetical protein